MTNEKSLIKINNKITTAYYPIVAVCYCVTMFTSLMRPGVIAAILMLITGALGVAVILKQNPIKAEKNGLPVLKKIKLIDILVAAFIVYSLLSVIWLKASGMPTYVYTGELATFVLPSVFYIVGRIKESGESFYKGFLIGLFAICGVGLILYIWAPQFYLDYLYDWMYTSLADVPTMRVRMNSVVGSTILGAISVAGMLAGAAVFANGKRKAMGIAGFFTGFIFAILSNQRSAMVVAILIALYINFLMFFTFKTFKMKYFYIEVAMIVLLFIVLLIIAPGMLLKVYYRLESLPLAIGERSESWVAAVNMMFSTWLGNGLGANGHRAIGIEGAKIVADGGLVKMFCELGILGFSIFLYILVLIYKKGIKSFADCFAELGIISVFLLQSVGSNVLTFQLVTPVFWYALGKCVFVIYDNESNSPLKKNMEEE